MNKIFLLAFSILFLSCSIGKDESVANNLYKKHTIQFINSITSNEKEQILLLNIAPTFPQWNDACHYDIVSLNRGYFADDELKFIEKELSSKESKWNTYDLANTKVIREKKYFHDFGHYYVADPVELEKMKTLNYREYSKPIFLKDFTYCLFYQGFVCGSYCAGGEFKLYKKIENKWIEVKSYCKWSL